MKKLLQAVTLATATGLAACSTAKLANAQDVDVVHIKYTETEYDISNTQEETQQETRNILGNRDITIPIHKLCQLMEELDNKRLKQLENLREYVYYTKLLLNEIKARGIIDYGENLDFDLNSILSNKRSKALLEFQKKFNRLLPGDHQISVDGKIGRETIGAILTVLNSEFHPNAPNRTQEIFYVASHNEQYYAQKRKEWAEQDRIDEKNRKIFESLDREKVETYTRQILNLTPQSGPIVLPDTMNSLEAGMALWKVWESTLNKHIMEDLTSEHFIKSKDKNYRKFPKIIVSKSLKEIITIQLIPYLERLYDWSDTEGSPTNFNNSLIIKD